MEIISKVKNSLVKHYVFIRQLITVRSIYKNSRKIALTEGLAIFPCDPETVIGSRGDEAMITAAINEFRSRKPDAPIYIYAKDDTAEQYLSIAGLDKKIEIVKCWNQAYPIKRIYDSVVSIAPEEAVVIGADCMDGAYSPSLSLELLSIYNLLVSVGIKASLLGFSYNDHPYYLINKAFSYFNNVSYRLRDEISCDRFNRMTGNHGVLVADSAFMMHPDFSFSGYDDLKKWVECHRSSGCPVIAFNFHPMLKTYSSKDEIIFDAQRVGSNLIKIIKENSDIAIVLLPHDDRARINDGTMLDIVYDEMTRANVTDRVYYLRKVPRAAQLKAITGLMDGVISSRMHLAIAALGMGVPVMVADYQGKFEGLFKHFSLPEHFILTPEFFCSGVFLERYKDFISQLQSLKGKIDCKLNKVMSLSALNFNKI